MGDVVVEVIFGLCVIDWWVLMLVWVMVVCCGGLMLCGNKCEMDIVECELWYWLFELVVIVYWLSMEVELVVKMLGMVGDVLVYVVMLGMVCVVVWWW